MAVVDSSGARVGASGGVDRGALRSRIRHLRDGGVQACGRSLHLCWARVSGGGVFARCDGGVVGGCRELGWTAKVDRWPLVCRRLAVAHRRYRSQIWVVGSAQPFLPAALRHRIWASDIACRDRHSVFNVVFTRRPDTTYIWYTCTGNVVISYTVTMDRYPPSELHGNSRSLWQHQGK